MRYLYVACKTGPGNGPMPIRVEPARESTISPNCRQEAVPRTAGRREECGITEKILDLEETTEDVADRVSQRLSGIAQTAPIEPAIGALIGESPANVSKRRVCIRTSGSEPFGLHERP